VTVAELVELLEEYDPGTEVRLMEQPSWPFEYSIVGTWAPQPQGPTCHGMADPGHDPSECDECQRAEDAFTPEGSPPAGVVYLVEGQQLAYGTKRAWEVAERSY
jgi:hypothetical protein